MDSPKLLYIVVVDADGSSFRYTRSALQASLQLIGCKPRHAFKISRRVFDRLRRVHDAAATSSSDWEVAGSPRPFELYKRRTTVVIERSRFVDTVCEALGDCKYVGPNQRADFLHACRIRERKESVTIFLCGASGCGKSTLSTLLGSRLGITTIVSTDSIRHMMRSFADEKQNPLLWASTYHAGECLDPVAVSKAKARRKAKKQSVISNMSLKDDVAGVLDGQETEPLGSATDYEITKKQLAIEGYKAQSEMVIDSLDRLITAWEERKESVVVEGVHLSLNFVMGLMKKHPSIIPFMVCIANEDKHLERFAVRAKYMTLDPAKNRYVKYIRNIRTIQDYLCNRADKYLVPKINNTNVDRSVAAIHATVFSCLRRRFAGEQLYDPISKTVLVVSEEYRRQCAASMSSKGMFKLIQRQGSSRNMVAIVNSDGSVSKAWPFECSDANGKLPCDNGVGNPIYGPLKVGRAESVNVHFGPFGLSAWPGAVGCTSQAGCNDDTRTNDFDTSRLCGTSSYSAAKVLDWLGVEDKETSSSEETHSRLEFESDDDLSDIGIASVELPDEVEGSVDENSTKSDEEYDDLAMLDVEGSYCTDDDDELRTSYEQPSPSTHSEQRNLDEPPSHDMHEHDEGYRGSYTTDGKYGHNLNSNSIGVCLDVTSKHRNGPTHTETFLTCAGKQRSNIRWNGSLSDSFRLVPLSHRISLRSVT